MNPQYSILLCNQSIAEYESRITAWLLNGIKVLWFGTEEEADFLKARHADFAKAFLLQAYSATLSDAGILLDGRGDQKLFRAIAEDCPLFNSAQYEVEHCDAPEHIVVQASAGTGKTTVMIDRILYLLHTQPGLKASEIFMITFTNDAAEQMNHRLQDALMTRYALTKQQRYLRWVEEQSQMHISTIHSFAYAMLKQLGIGESFTKGLAIQTFEQEKKDLIKDALNEAVDDGSSICSQLGVPFYRANALVRDYWQKFSQLGVSHRELPEMDWGLPVDENSKNFHQLIQKLTVELDDRYFALKRQKEAISLNDIMRDLQEVLTGGELPETDLSMKYLFIDEFQDSDLSQIRVACLLGRLMGAVLFVVGDAKQSIYRFRGASDQAFALFYRAMREMGLPEPKEFHLINNYRTAAGVLNRMDDYFFSWGRLGYLDYDQPVVPFNRRNGKIRMLPISSREPDSGFLAKLVSDELNALIAKVDASGREPNEKDRVALLTRSNAELDKLAKILRTAKIPAVVRRGGAFYTSEAVRDFYAMISSYLYCDEPKYLFNYLMTPYAGEIVPMDIHAMEHQDGDKERLNAYLKHFIDQTEWRNYHRELCLKPVLSVLREMLDQEPVIDSYIALTKAKREAEGWAEARINADTLTRARQYQANLEKLLEVLQNQFGGGKGSLYEICSFLQQNIAGNRSEEEAEVRSRDDYTSVLCMTIHKSKGLEFDTVIIPYTEERFGAWPRTELLVDPVEKKVGWYYTGDKTNVKRRYKYPEMKSSCYDELQKKENWSGKLEGVRVLYVGMTRAIDTLICVVAKSRTPMTWAQLIEDVEVDYE